MAGKEKVSIKRSDQFQEVDEELSRVMEELDMTIERVSAIFEGKSEEDLEELIAEKEAGAAEAVEAVDEQGEADAEDERVVQAAPNASGDEAAVPSEETGTQSKEDTAETEAG